MLQDRKKIFFALFGLLAVNIFIYLPSLSYWPRSDAWAYFINTAGIDDFFHLVTKFYSYDRVVNIEPGYAALFRPFLFSLLAFEKSFFGLNFFLWQGTSLFLHLSFIALLFSTILKIVKNLAAALGAALMISFIPGAQEMVFWPQISGYLIFLLTQLFAVNILYDSMIVDRPSSARALALAVVMFISAGFHEFGAVLLLVMFCIVCLFREKLGDRSFVYIKWLIVAIVLYFSWYISDYAMHIEHIRAVESCVSGGWQGGLSLSPEMIWEMPLRILRAFITWACVPLFPVLCEYFASFRICMDIWPMRIFSWQFFLNFSGMAILFCYFCCLFSRKAVKQKLPVVIFYLLAVFLFMVIVCLSRGRFGYIYIFLFNGYYYYLFWAFFLPLIIMVCDWEKAAGRYRGLSYVAAGCAVVYFCFCAWIVYGINMAYARTAAVHSWYLADIKKFISSHAHEKDLSFSLVDREKLANLRFPVLEHKDGVYTMVEKQFDPVYALFAKYIDDTEPKYIARYDPVTGLIWSPAVKVDSDAKNE